MPASLPCPICRRPVALGEPRAEAFPFCSSRCRQIDLGRWADGSYVVPGRDLGEIAEQSQGRDREDAGS